MITVNIDFPTSCVKCPFLFEEKQSFEDGTVFLERKCMAMGKRLDDICGYVDIYGNVSASYFGDPIVTKDTKPTWCPIIRRINT